MSSIPVEGTLPEGGPYLILGLDIYPKVLEGIEDLLAEVGPRAEQLDSPERWAAALQQALDAVPSARRKDVIEVLRPEIETDSPSLSKVSRVILDAFFTEPWGPPLVNAIRETVIRRPRLPILLNSLLTNLVSSFETHLSEVAGSIYRAEPGSLDGARELEFSLADLREMGSIEEAVDLAVRRRVEKLTRGSIGDWRKHFRDSVKIDIADLAIDFEKVQEILQRRNAIVHHDAMASPQYLRATGRTDVSRGADLSCDVEYVRSAIDELLILGFLLSLECLRKFLKDEEYVAQRLHNFEEKLLPGMRWRALQKIGEHGLAHFDDAAGHNVAQVNVWLSRKNLYGLDSVRADIDAWDVTASDGLFVLAKACLLQALDEAFELIPDLIASGRLSGRELLEWPIFADVRMDPRFGDLKESVSDSVIAEDEEEDGGAGLVAAPGSAVYHLSGCSRAGARAEVLAPDEIAGRRPARCCLVRA